MSYVNPINLSDDHPLSFKQIQKLHSNFQSSLDPNDICFPYFYRIPEIISGGGNEKKERFNCHSITALKNYNFLSFEEMRYLNYSKKHQKKNLQNPQVINSIKAAKFQSAKIILLSQQYKTYVFDLLTEDEKKQLQEYCSLYNSGVDKSADCLGNEFNHVNFNLQVYAAKENSKLNISPGITTGVGGYVGGSFTAANVNNINCFNANKALFGFGNNGNNNAIGLDNNVAAANLNNNNIGNTIGNASNLNSNLNNINNNNNLIGNNNLLLPHNNFQSSSMNNTYNNLISNTTTTNNNIISHNPINKDNFGFGSGNSYQNQNNPLLNSNLNLNQFNNPPISFQNQNNTIQNPINNSISNQNNLNNPSVFPPCFSSNPSTNASSTLNNINNNNQTMINSLNTQAGFNPDIKSFATNNNTSSFNYALNSNSSNNNNNSNNLNQNTAVSSSIIISNSDPKLNKNLLLNSSEVKFGLMKSENLNFNVTEQQQPAKESLFAKLIEKIVVNDNSNQNSLNYLRFTNNPSRNIKDKSHQIKGVGAVFDINKANFAYDAHDVEEELKNKSLINDQIVASSGNDNNQDCKFKRYLDRKEKVMRLKKEFEDNKIKENIITQPLKPNKKADEEEVNINSNNNNKKNEKENRHYNNDSNSNMNLHSINNLVKNLKSPSCFSKIPDNNLKYIFNNYKNNEIIQHNKKSSEEDHNEIHRKIQLKNNRNETKLLEKELKADMLLGNPENNNREKEQFNNCCDNPNKNYVKNINFEKDFIFIKSNTIHEANGKFELSNFIDFEGENSNNEFNFNKLIKITIPKNDEYEEFILYLLTKENLDLENLKKVFIYYLKKSMLYSLIPDECFMSYLELILLGNGKDKAKKAIPKREASEILLDDIENTIEIKNSKIGFFWVKFIELYYLISFSDLKKEYKKISALQIKDCENNMLFNNKNNYPILRENLNRFVLNPPYEEILSMDYYSIKSLGSFTVENQFGKVVFLEPLDLEGVFLDSIKLDYFYFEILNLHPKSYMNLNKNCKVYLYTDEIKNDHDYIVCLKKLKAHYKNLQVNFHRYLI